MHHDAFLADSVQLRPASQRVCVGEGVIAGPSGSCVSSPLRTPYVLVVDDDFGTRETFDWALRSSGIRIRTSASGREAIEASKTDSFDLLLVDLELGDMRGTDVIRAVRTEAAAVPSCLAWKRWNWRVSMNTR